MHVCACIYGTYSPARGRAQRRFRLWLVCAPLIAHQRTAGIFHEGSGAPLDFCFSGGNPHYISVVPFLSARSPVS